MSPQVGTRTTALIRTIPDMQLMVTPRATMVEVTSARARLPVIVAARTPEAETVVVAEMAVATDACLTDWEVDTRSLLPQEVQSTKL
jgi:phosphoglycerate dehydrogenase-like enzyme